jgi:hypothetical protein
MMPVKKMNILPQNATNWWSTPLFPKPIFLKIFLDMGVAGKVILYIFAPGLQQRPQNKFGM